MDKVGCIRSDGLGWMAQVGWIRLYICIRLDVIGRMPQVECIRSYVLGRMYQIGCIRLDVLDQMYQVGCSLKLYSVPISAAQEGKEQVDSSPSCKPRRQRRRYSHNKFSKVVLLLLVSTSLHTHHSFVTVDQYTSSGCPMHRQINELDSAKQLYLSTI